MFLNAETCIQKVKKIQLSDDLIGPSRKNHAEFKSQWKAFNLKYKSQRKHQKSKTFQML